MEHDMLAGLNVLDLGTRFSLLINCITSFNEKGKICYLEKHTVFSLLFLEIL